MQIWPFGRIDFGASLGGHIVVAAPSPTEWLGAIAALVTAGAAAYAAFVGIRTLEHRRALDDVTLSFEILKEIATYWDEMVSDPKNRQYYIGQIITNFEYAASLYNKDMLNEEASEILVNYILDTMRAFKSDPDAQPFFQDLQSTGEPLAHLSVFLRKRKELPPGE